MTKQEAFFWFNAGYSYSPTSETPEAGRLRCAVDLASAENESKERGWHTEWHNDEPIAFEGEVLNAYAAILYNEAGDMIGSIGGVTFEDNSLSSDPYRRVVEAELAHEALSSVQPPCAVQ